MRSGGALFVLGRLARFWPDSARTKKAVATMTGTQKINLVAVDIFILLVLSYTPAFWISFCRNAADALRFSARDIAQALAKKASRIFLADEETFDLSVISEWFLLSCAPYGRGAGVGRGLGVTVGRVPGPCAAVLRIAPNAPIAFPTLVSGVETP